jgi:hypothetical protein
VKTRRAPGGRGQGDFLLKIIIPLILIFSHFRNLFSDLIDKKIFDIILAER